jgi:PAS domain S-box-containing protein
LSLANIPATPRQGIFAALTAGIITVVPIVLLSRAQEPIHGFAETLPAMSTGVLIADVMTAFMLFSASAMERSRAAAILAGAYLFAALICVSYFLTFPGLFSPAGLFGTLPQASISLWICFHMGFALFIIAYAVVLQLPRQELTRTATTQFLGWVGGGTCVLAVAVSVAIIVNARSALAPTGSVAHLTLSAAVVVIVAEVLATLLVLRSLLDARIRSITQVWLAVACYAMLVNTVLTYLSGNRFTAGWFSERGLSFVASSVVLGAILVGARRLMLLVRDSEQRLQTVVRGVGDALLVIDADDRITEANPAALALFEYAQSDLLGSSIDAIVPNYRDQIGSAHPTGGAIEVTATKYDGTAFPLELGRGEDGMILMGRDITQRKRAEEAIRAAHNRAIEAADVKAQFLATMSHEIRTPINAVVGMSELLLRTPLPAEARDYAMVVRESAESLLSVVNDILDFSKIEAGKVQLEKIPFSIVGAIESTADILMSNATKKGLALSTFIAPDVPQYVLGDTNYVRQILLNLIGNAVKFTAAGSVQIRAVVDSVQPKKITSVKMSVSDTGAGIASDLVAELFEPFAQGALSTRRRFGGTGLGLSICKRLVSLMGGEMGVTSEPGSGSTFWFTIPFERADELVVAETPSLRGYRILVVDAETASRDILDQYLLSWGAIATKTASPDHALTFMRAAATRANPYDAVLIQYVLPETDGYALAARILAEPALRQTPLVLMSATEAARHAAEASEHGFRAFLREPFRQSSLFDALAGAVRRVDTALLAPPQEVDSRRESTSALPTPQTQDAPQQDITVLIVEDNPVNRKLALQQLKKLGYHSAAVIDGREAIKAVKRKRYDLVLMDCQMPDVDGFTATREIRTWEAEGGSHVPIVAMTASVLAGDREACLAAGMDDFLAKPVQLDALRAALERYTGSTVGVR